MRPHDDRPPIWARKTAAPTTEVNILCSIFSSCFPGLKSMPKKAIDKRAAAQAAWREMARGMRQFIAIQVERGADSGKPRDANLAYIKEQIGVAVADAAGRLCEEGQPLVLTPEECVDLTNIGYAMQRQPEQTK